MIQVGDTVEKKGRAGDYTTGRQGVVVMIDKYAERAQVKWHTCKTQGQINITTWVVIGTSRGLKKVEDKNQLAIEAK